MPLNQTESRTLSNAYGVSVRAKLEVNYKTEIKRDGLCVRTIP